MQADLCLGLGRSCEAGGRQERLTRQMETRRKGHCLAEPEPKAGGPNLAPRA